MRMAYIIKMGIWYNIKVTMIINWIQECNDTHQEAKLVEK